MTLITRDLLALVLLRELSLSEAIVMHAERQSIEADSEDDITDPAEMERLFMEEFCK